MKSRLINYIYIQFSYCLYRKRIPSDLSEKKIPIIYFPSRHANFRVCTLGIPIYVAFYDDSE